MKKLILPLAACAAGALVLSALARPSDMSRLELRSYEDACTNLWANEPVLVYNVQGSTLVELVHTNMVVYNSGSVMLTSTSSAPTEGAPQTCFSVDPMVAQQLLYDLAAAGAFTACDGIAAVSDVPLTTVTVFSGTTDARAHTFSFFDNLSDPTHGDVQDIIQEFIAGL